MTRHFITATVITRNEARNIERCLNSLIGVADEIVVVDSCSEDATVDICRRYGCKVHIRPFTGYGSQRQYAVSLANGRYILSIDADEVLSDGLRRSLMKLKAEGFDHRMYTFNITNYICGQPMRGSGLEPYREIRLFDKRYANWDLLDVGERLTYEGAIVPCLVEGELLHFRCSDFSELDDKEMRHAVLRGQLMASAGIDAIPPVQWFRAACSYLHCQLRQGAIFDGDAGHRVARTRFRATLAAYRTARNLIKRNKK